MAEVPKILIVDDDAEIVESLKAILESRGYSVKSARDGSAGLAEAEANPPDLMILDMMMPKKSGFMVLEKLRTRPTKPSNQNGKPRHVVVVSPVLISL